MKERKGRSAAGGIILILVLILVLAAVLLFLGRWQLQVELLGEAECTVEFGEAYRDPGAEAVFGGERYLRALFRPEVETEGSVNTRALGEHTLRYSAAFLWFSDSRTRLVRVVDTEPPVITLLRTPGSFTLPGEAYAEEGYNALDNADGDLTDRVERREENGTVYYRVTDSSGNSTEIQRRIEYDDPVPPTITLLGGERITLAYGTQYVEPGYTALDNVDGDLTALVSVTGEVIPDSPGDYELRYAVEDGRHNRAEAVRIVTVGPKPTGVVYLTFDDGPSKHTQDLLDILDRYGVKVTFFVVNYGYNDMIGKEAAAGHSVGVHSATHDYHSIYASEEAYFADLDKMNDIIYAQTGAYSDIIRFPGGSSNTVSSFNPGIMTTLAADLTDMGYQYFDWNVSSGDAGETTETQQVYENVINGVQWQNVSIVLQHDIKGFSVAAVEQIIVWGLNNGYTFLPLDPTSPTSHHRIAN